MYFSEVMKKCEEEGIKITRPGLYHIGKKYGFIVSETKNGGNNFIKEKFLDWIKRIKEEIPEGWINVDEVHKRFGISLTKAYEIVKDEDCEARPFGRRNVIYVDPERIKEVIDKRNHRYEL